MRWVDGFAADLVYLVQDIEQIALGVETGALDAGEDLADELLTWRWAVPGAFSSGGLMHR
jgi:hypothetical protein